MPLLQQQGLQNQSQIEYSYFSNREKNCKYCSCASNNCYYSKERHVDVLWCHINVASISYQSCMFAENCSNKAFLKINNSAS